jgi:hypothetical protein
VGPRRVLLAIALVAGVAAPSEAHRPYEGRPRTLTTASGRIEVVQSYIDGLFFTDPAKIVVRSRGRTIAETAYFRETSLLCSRTRCYASVMDSPLRVVPDHVWIVSGEGLRSADTLVARLLAVPVHVWDHALGYAIALLVLAGSTAGLTRWWDRPPRTAVEALLTGSGRLASALVLLLWLYAVALLSELSLVWILLLSAGLFLAFRRIFPFRLRRPPAFRTGVT